MTQEETRHKYAEYIATGWREAAIEHKGIHWPEKTVIIANRHCGLDELGINELLGLPVFVADLHSGYDFILAIPSASEKERKLLKAFDDWRDYTPFDTFKGE